MVTDIPSTDYVQAGPTPFFFHSAPNLTCGFVDKGKRPVSSDSSDVVVKFSVQPSVGNNTLALAIKNIGLASAPQPIVPHAPFFKNDALEDSYWKSKGKRMLSAVDQEAYFPAGKRSAFSPPPVIPPPNINPVDENPPMNVDPAADPYFGYPQKIKDSFDILQSQ